MHFASTFSSAIVMSHQSVTHILEKLEKNIQKNEAEVVRECYCTGVAALILKDERVLCR